MVWVADAEELARPVTVLNHLQSYPAKAGGLDVINFNYWLS